jgi:predicted ATPase
VDIVLTYDAATLAAFKSRILSRDEGLGDNASVAIQLVTSLSLITGPQPAAPQLGLTESQNRLHRTFLQLLRLFTSEATPLVRIGIHLRVACHGI